MAKINPAVKKVLLASINTREPEQVYKWLNDGTLNLKELIDARIEISTLEGIPTSKYPDLIQFAIQENHVSTDDLKDYGVSDIALGIEKTTTNETETGMDLNEEPTSELTPEQDLLIWEINNNAISIEMIKHF